MNTIKCTKCGGVIGFNYGDPMAVCPQCGTRHTLAYQKPQEKIQPPAPTRPAPPQPPTPRQPVYNNQPSIYQPSMEEDIEEGSGKKLLGITIAAGVILLVLIVLVTVVMVKLKKPKVNKDAETTSVAELTDFLNEVADTTAAEENVLSPEYQYKKGTESLEIKKFEEAIQYFTAAGEYKDAADKIKECKYRWALELMNAGEYNKAYTLLSEIKGYNTHVDYLLVNDKNLKKYNPDVTTTLFEDTRPYVPQGSITTENGKEVYNFANAEFVQRYNTAKSALYPSLADATVSGTESVSAGTRYTVKLSQSIKAVVTAGSSGKIKNITMVWKFSDVADEYSDELYEKKIAEYSEAVFAAIVGDGYNQSISDNFKTKFKGLRNSGTAGSTVLEGMTVTMLVNNGTTRLEFAPGVNQEREFTVTVKTSGDTLNLRADNNSSSEKLGEIPNGTVLKTTQIIDGWAKVNYDGKVGWISLKYAEVE